MVLLLFKPLCTCFSWALGISCAKSSSLQCLTLMRQLQADGTAKTIRLPWIQQVINPMWSVLRRWNQPFFLWWKTQVENKKPPKRCFRSPSLQFFAVFERKMPTATLLRSPKVWTIWLMWLCPLARSILKLRNNKTTTGHRRWRKLTGWRFPQMVVVRPREFTRKRNKSDHPYHSLPKNFWFPQPLTNLRSNFWGTTNKKILSLRIISSLI